ncbi:hypothetical protein LOTGIDRAFT_235746 [Lottia gigantea]|uniref:Mitochondrial glycine transporter n=1 Tax=Lottia gigantea TaxID=225164 RepID=V3ZXS3_LOTGI|nr:hypothetical protein LOTGIDRAFT_235746 [Lottia gigantea]ESO85786.1 hypothetical protein LOTGIDRAFT_235746 [Lottia gigantea]
MESTVLSPILKSFLAGSFSGTCSTLLFQPLDLVKTRIQTSVTHGNHVGMVQVFTNVVKDEKLTGLWRGVLPSITRCVPGVGIYFSTLHYMRTKVGSADPHPLESLALGGTARCVAGVAVLPFTVVKTRFESGLYAYRSMYQALVGIYTVEGLRGLYSGLAPTLLRDAPFSGLYLMFYTQIKKYIPEGQNMTPIIHFQCGLLAGMMASMVTQPADVIKTHMQLQPNKYSSIKSAVKYVFQCEGIVGFWRGLIPRTLRRTLICAMAWTVYEQIMKPAGLSK